jgi:Tfp pilus assembly protein PilN
MVWLQTTSPTLNTVRREIARWARDTDEAMAELFGRRVKSDEIRVLLEEMPALVPRQVDATDRAWLETVSVEARRLTSEGRAAITHVTG